MENFPQNKELLKLKIAYFFTSHQIFLKRLAIFLGILVCLGFYGYSVYHFTDFILRTGDHEKMLNGLTANYVNHGDFVLSHSPKPLVILEQKAIPSVAGEYDFVAKIKNPNNKWRVGKLKYAFEWAGGQTEIKEEAILPGEETYLLLLGEKIDGGLAGEVKLKLAEVGWERFKGQMAVSNNDFIIIKKEFLPASNVKNQITPARAVFEACNNTLYGFWEAGFKIILLRGYEIEAVNYASATKFRSGETIAGEAVWTEPVLTPNEIIIEPAIDFLSSENFMTPESSRGELK